MFRRITFAFALFALAMMPAIASIPVRAASSRFVTIAAKCTAPSSSTKPPAVDITVENHSGLLLHVAYYQSFQTGEALQGGLSGIALTAPKQQASVQIPDGATLTIAAPWTGGDVVAKLPVVALVLSSAGVFLPACDSTTVQRYDYPDPQPTVAGEEGMESAALAAKMIGALESFRAWSPLYALLHPDAQKLVSFKAFACSYASQYGPPVTKTTRTIYSTTIADVSFVNWTWPGNGSAYTKVAEVSYAQKSGVFPQEDAPVDSVEHLVRVDGVWRFFYGSDPQSIAALDDSCTLPAFS